VVKKGDDMNANLAQHMACIKNYFFFDYWYSRTVASNFSNSNSNTFNLSQH